MREWCDFERCECEWLWLRVLLCDCERCDFESCDFEWCDCERCDFEL